MARFSLFRFVAACVAVAVVTLGLSWSAPAANAAPGDPFSAGSGLVFVAQGPARGQPSTLYEAVQGAGAITFVRQGTATVGYNAMGFRVADRYLYAINDNGGLVRIGQGGVNTALGQVGLPSNDANYNQGTFGSGATADILYVRLGTSDRNLYAVNVPARTSTRIQLSAAVPNLSDMVWSNGYLWGVYGEGSRLYRMNPTTGEVISVAITGLPQNPYGAQWIYGNGNIGVSNNVTGTVYQLELVDPTSAAPSIRVLSSTSGPANTQNDGASAPGLPVDLGIVKTGPAEYAAGDTMSYTLTVHNYGPGDSSGYIVRDTLPSLLLNASTSTPGCAIILEAGVSIVQCAGGPLANGADAPVITITGTAPGLTGPPSCLEGAITNVARVIGNEADPTPGNDTSTSTACPIGAVPPSFTVAKTASTSQPQSVALGDTVTYTVTVQNTGTVAYTEASPAVFLDDLSNVLDDAQINLGSITGGATFVNNSIRWSGALAVGSSVTVSYSVTVNDPDTGDHLLTNAVVPGGTGSCVDANSCSVTTPVAAYTVSKSTTSTQVAAGETIEYIITVVNTGAVNFGGSTVPNRPAAAIDDSLTGLLPYATYNGDASGGGTVVGNNLHWDVNLPIGATVQLSYSMTVNAGVSGQVSLVNLVTPGSDGRCTAPDACTTVTPVGSYTVSKRVSATQASPGDSLSYTVTVVNTGSAAIASASFVDDLSDVIDDASVDVQSITGGASFANGEISWTGALAVGATVEVSYTVIINSPDLGNHVLVNAVVPGGSGDCVDACTTTTPVKAFTISKSASVTEAFPGDTVSYQIVVVNTGAVNFGGVDEPFTTLATVSDPLTDVLPFATYNNDANNGGVLQGDVLEWAVALPIGGTVTLSFSVTVTSTATANPHLRNVAIPGDGGECTGAADCTTDVPLAHFTVSKSVDPTTASAGTTLRYTIRVTNTSDVAFTSAKPASFTDDLSGVLDDATYNNDVTLGATVSNNTLSWAGALNPTEVKSVSYSVTVKTPLSGDKSLRNVVVPGTGGGCESANGCETTVVVTPPTPKPTPTPTTAGTLPSTGFDPGLSVLGALALAVLGAALLPLARRRSRARS